LLSGLVVLVVAHACAAGVWRRLPEVRACRYKHKSYTAQGMMCGLKAHNMLVTACNTRAKQQGGRGSADQADSDNIVMLK